MGIGRGLIEFSVDTVEKAAAGRAIAAVELVMYRSWVTRQGAGKELSMMRDLHRTSFINIAADYTGAFGLINTIPFDSAIVDSCNDSCYGVVDPYVSFTQGEGWDTFNITQVVLDSLNSVRKKVTLLGKLRDETVSDGRKIDYNPDVYFDSTKATKLMVIYSDGTSIQSRRLPGSTLAISQFSIARIYSLDGRCVCEMNSGNEASLIQTLNRQAKGIYLVNARLKDGTSYLSKMWTNK